MDLSQSGQGMATFVQNFPAIPRESSFIRLLTLPLIAFILALLLSGLFSRNPYPALITTCWLLVLLIYWPGIIGRVNIEAVESPASRPPDRLASYFIYHPADAGS